MELPDGFWLLSAIIVAGSALLLYLRWRRQDVEKAAGMADTGSAIVAFTKAFPDLAVRDVVMTKNMLCAFLRIADGRVGFVEHTSLHVAARLLDPHTLIVGVPGDTRTISVAFPGGGDGTYEFASTEEAAEVSLWLCGEFAVAGAESPSPAEGSDRE
ncbi:hypothetical protein [Hoeflea sp.]|uniref:hypothetical protein n=1 Tax=Hoeflea sp. TaxID=1940281 RepID=UPI003B01B0E8